MLQQAVANGLTTFDFLIQAEENNSNVDGRLDFYSSDEASAALRPSLNITYRMTNAYIDAKPQLDYCQLMQQPFGDYSSPRPSGADHVNLSWTPPPSKQ